METHRINILGLRTTIYKVPDLQQAKIWYAEAFQTSPYYDEVFYVGFSIGGFELGLLPETGEKVMRSASGVAYWGVDSMENTYKHMLAVGAAPNEAPENVGGDIITATVIDPWGNIIGLIYNPHFKISK